MYTCTLRNESKILKPCYLFPSPDLLCMLFLQPDVQTIDCFWNFGFILSSSNDYIYIGLYKHTRGITSASIHLQPTTSRAHECENWQHYNSICLLASLLAYMHGLAQCWVSEKTVVDVDYHGCMGCQLYRGEILRSFTVYLWLLLEFLWSTLKTVWCPQLSDEVFARGNGLFNSSFWCHH